MTVVRKTLAEVQAGRSPLSARERARLDAMTDDDIERRAAGDPDNHPLADAELDRAVAARAVRRARERTGLSQAQFAARFRINLARLRDLEQGRHRPDSALLAYLLVIEHDPDAVAQVLGADGEAA